MNKICFLSTCLLIALTLCGQEPTGSSSLSSARRAEISRLIENLSVRNSDDLRRYTPQFRDDLTTRFRELLSREITAQLAVDPSNLAELRKSLARLEPDPELQGTFAFAAQVNGRPYVLTGYLLLRGPEVLRDSRSIIQIYSSPGDDHYELTAETGGDLDGFDLTLAPVQSPTPGEFWFLAHGVQFGHSGRLTRVRLFGFDGDHIRTIWAPADHLQTKVKLQSKEITLTYLDEERYHRVRVPPFTRIDRVLLTDSGVVELSSELAPQ